MANEESITNCPNCGSVLNEKEGYLTCAYCGTTIYDFATLDTEKPFYMRVKTQDGIILTKVRCDSAELDADFQHFLLEGYPAYKWSLLNDSYIRELTMKFQIVQGEDKNDY